MATPTASKVLWSTIGRKIFIALTGLGLFGFLVTHVIANVMALFNRDAFNHYSHTLISNPFIYVLEAGLGGLFLIHAGTAIANLMGNKQARSSRYEAREWAGGSSRKSLASTFMAVTGVVMLLWLPYHIYTFKFGPWYETTDGMRDLHRLVFEVFRDPRYVIGYVIVMTLVGMHLWHGFSSAFQTLGFDHKRYTPWVRGAGWVLAFVMAGGFISIPVLIYLRIV